VEDKTNLIMDSIKKLIPKEYRDKLTPSSLLFRIVNFLLTSFLMSIYAYVPFILYMSEYNFYSYDFFTTEGLFAINVFLFIIVSFIFAISITLTLGLVKYFYDYILMKNGITDGSNSKDFKFITIANFIFLLIVIIMFIFLEDKNNEALYTILFFYILSFLVSFQMIISFSLSAKAKYVLLSTILIYMFILPVLFINNQKQVATLVSISLKKFGVGGGINVEVYDKRFSENEKKNKGKLIFLSPKNIYINYENDNFLTIEERTSKFIKIEQKGKVLIKQ
jgi:hypothetical protein